MASTKKAKISSKIVGVSASVDGMQVFSNIAKPDTTEKEQPNEAATIEQTTEPTSRVVPRGEVTLGVAVKIDHPFIGKVYFKPFFNKDRQLVEVFVSISKQSPENIAQVGSIARLISTMLKHGVEVSEIVKHLKGSDAGQAVPVKFPGKEKTVFIKSLPDLIGTALELYSDFDFVMSLVDVSFADIVEQPNVQDELKEEKDNQKINEDEVDIAAPVVTTTYIPPESICPECGSVMRNEGGCWTCSCGYSKCG